MWCIVTLSVSELVYPGVTSGSVSIALCECREEFCDSIRLQEERRSPGVRAVVALLPHGNDLDK